MDRTWVAAVLSLAFALVAGALLTLSYRLYTKTERGNVPILRSDSSPSTHYSHENCGGFPIDSEGWQTRPCEKTPKFLNRLNLPKEAERTKVESKRRVPSLNVDPGGSIAAPRPEADQSLPSAKSAYTPPRVLETMDDWRRRIQVSDDVRRKESERDQLIGALQMQVEELRKPRQDWYSAIERWLLLLSTVGGFVCGALGVYFAYLGLQVSRHRAVSG